MAWLKVLKNYRENNEEIEAKTSFVFNSSFATKRYLHY